MQMMTEKNDCGAQSERHIMKGQHSKKKPHCHFCHREALRSPQRQETPQTPLQEAKEEGFPGMPPSPAAGMQASVTEREAGSGFEPLFMTRVKIQMTHSTGPRHTTRSNSVGSFLLPPSPTITPPDPNSTSRR